MFRNDHQKCEALSLLLEPVRLDRLWNQNGPTPEAAQRREVGGSPGERVMVRAAWDLWNGTGGVRLAEMLNTLDSVNFQLLATLLLAVDLGSDWVDLWILGRESGQHVASDQETIRNLLLVTIERDRLRDELAELRSKTE